MIGQSNFKKNNKNRDPNIFENIHIEAHRDKNNIYETADDKTDSNNKDQVNRVNRNIRHNYTYFIIFDYLVKLWIAIFGKLLVIEQKEMYMMNLR